ncbi:MAG: hypothetical protein WCA46_05930 [Actinocatenispora sp.]
MSKYLKFLVAVAAAVATVLVSALSDGHVSTVEWIQVAISVTTAVGVWATANVPTLTWAKAAVAAVLTVLNLLVTYISGGVTGPEWLNIGLAVLGTLGVYAVPNKGAPSYKVSGQTA